MSSAILSTLLDPIEAGVVAFDERSLTRAFASFTEAAASLERSYVQLQAEVGRLRHELEDTNRDLATSLEENHRMRQHLNRILQGLPCGVLVTEADGKVSLANPETERLLGTAGGAAGDWALPVWVRDLLECTQGSRSELECRCGNPEVEWIRVRRAQLSAEEGGSSIFILQDVSELKRLEREHADLSRRQALAEMSALLAHEIRNPLGSLELFAGLLAESDLKDDERNWVGHLQAGLRTLAATVNNVLHFHSQPSPGLAPTDLGCWLRSTYDFLRPLAQRAQVRMQLIQELDGVLVAADRHRLEQVLLNLALNAFRFMPSGGALAIRGQVSARAGQSMATVQISDTGPGVAADDRERIFDPGFTTCAGSPGLGLAVCKTIMEQHGGAITVVNGAGSGATFKLEFPLGGANQ
jgi:nitrogen fixation/metabolism regulation signal transduction histidine kinase